MSVVIKSNNLVTVSLGTPKMFGKTAQSEFDAYKARVLADGGVIKDEARTLKAFNMLFASKMYGNMNTAVSGTFGVKVDSNGGITKLYAIDGTDLIGTAYGTGTLPKLDANNNIDFSTNSLTDNVNGSMLTTASKMVVSKGNMGIHLYTKTWDVSNTSRLFHLTKHTDVPNTQQIVGVNGATNGELSINVQTGILKLTTTATYGTARVSTSGFGGYSPINFVVDTSNGVVVGNRLGIEVSSSSAQAVSELKTEDFYLDLGGQFASDKKYFAKAVIRDAFCFAHATREQAMAISSFGQ